jgi:multiple sugar transport system substrate-binding protein
VDDSNNDDSNENNEVITASVLLYEAVASMVEWNARDYEKFTNGRVKIEVKMVPNEQELHDEIEADARNGGGLYDGYLTSPVILGTAAMLNGFLDLTSYKNSEEAEWMDILLEIRDYLTSFDDRVYLIPLDGDTLTLYYRKDVLKALNLTVPRTWNEYNAVAKAVHNKTFDGKKISGSCITKKYKGQSHYFAHLILSTITQTNGTSTGSLFDSSNMAPLTGEAIVEMLRIQEEQSKYGTHNEFDESVFPVNNNKMIEGECALTIFWGGIMRSSHSEKLGIAPTPGSEFVLNRANGKLERCNIHNCPYAEYIEDIGLFVNYAPYAANGGWGGAVSNNTSDDKKKILVEFFLWASSGEQSEKYVIPNATTPVEGITGQDPWRKSHLDLDKWVAKGFNRELSNQFVDTVYSNFISENIVTEIIFPHASKIIDILDKEVSTYLVKAHKGLIPEGTSYDERMELAQAITDKWNNIITKYDKRLDTVAPILEIYQRSRGVFTPHIDKNQLKNTRIVGYILMSIILVSSTGALIWVVINRNLPVVMASQPPFLIIICVGTFIMGTSILPLGIDESIASEKGCSIACMSVPWLIAIGFSVCFAALFSK